MQTCLYPLRWLCLLCLLFLISWKSLLPGDFAWNKTTHDFDRLLRGETYTYRFTFTNSGDAPLSILEVNCPTPQMTAKWASAPVKPLQSGWIEVTLVPVKAGPLMLSLNVKSDGATPLTTLWIKGEVMTAQEMKTGNPPRVQN